MRKKCCSVPVQTRSGWMGETKHPPRKTLPSSASSMLLAEGSPHLIGMVAAPNTGHLAALGTSITILSMRLGPCPDHQSQWNRSQGTPPCRSLVVARRIPKFRRSIQGFLERSSSPVLPGRQDYEATQCTQGTREGDRKCKICSCCSEVCGTY